MNYLRYLAVGIFFGIVLAKAEVISWFRIYEMFQFDSFHMHGIIISAIILGIIGVQIIKGRKLTDWTDEQITFRPKDMSPTRYLAGGVVFGLGWALAGACPGPMFILVGYGYPALIIVIVSAVLGTLVYGMLRKRLPH